MNELIENFIPFLLYFLFLCFLVYGFRTPKEENHETKKKEEKDTKASDTAESTNDRDKLKYYPLFFGKREDKAQDIQVGTINASDENTWYRDAVWMVQNTDGTISLHMEKPKLDPVTGIYTSDSCLCPSVPVLPPPNIRPGKPPVLVCMIVQELDPNTDLNIIKK